MTNPYYLAVTTESQYKRLFKTEKMSKLRNLSSAEKIPASSCKRVHLFAFHVIVEKSGLDLLPLYRDAEITTSVDSDNPEITAYINGVRTEDVKGMFEHQLTHTFGFSLGQLWGALHMIKQGPSKRRDISEVEKGSSPSPIKKQPKRNVSLPSYVSPPDSDPLGPPSSQGSNTSYTEGVKAKELQSEDYTVRLATCVLRHILNYTQGQDVDIALEVRERERQLSLVLPKVPVTFTSIDDGGLCLRFKDKDAAQKSFVALLEAKKRLLVFDGKAQISDEALAQMSCEAVLARATHGDEVCGDSVIIIHIARHYLCFLEFQMSDDYISQVKQGKTLDDSLRVHMTKWFNIDSADGRRGILNNIDRLVVQARESIHD
ncbi:hypothetical protein ACHAPU_010804 [Fusarium lateritium]